VFEPPTRSLGQSRGSVALLLLSTDANLTGNVFGGAVEFGAGPVRTPSRRTSPIPCAG
jgi:hypothetical protein